MKYVNIDCYIAMVLCVESIYSVSVIMNVCMISNQVIVDGKVCMSAGNRSQ